MMCDSWGARIAAVKRRPEAELRPRRSAPGS